MKVRLIPTLLILLVVGLMIWLITMRAGKPAPPTEQETGTAISPVDKDRQGFSLSPRKQAAAGIEFAAVQRRMLKPLARVPGRIQYDDTRHVAIRAPTAGILARVNVKPGVEVKAGDVVAVMSSPEVGAARADALRRKVELQIARRNYEWRKSACDGLRKLVEAVQGNEDPQSILESAKIETLGAYREQVVSAYSRYRLARSLANAVDSSQGALPGRTIQERLSERDAAQAALKSITEQSLFQACRESSLAQLEANDAELRFQISQQELQTLLGYREEPDPDIDDSQLSLVEIQAPIDGTIESRFFSNRERLSRGDGLFILANTSRLWVSADIREQEWSALNLKPGQELAITTPSLPGRRLVSHVDHIGREVNPETNAVPLVAVIQNEDGLLRPGQFVWVELPLGEPRSGLAVPDSAVVEHAGQSFVFVSAGSDRFRKVDVTPGIREGDLVEVRGGLEEGDNVVVQGAFALKSELLLEREE